MTNATEFVLIPFTHKGFEFVSKISTTSPYLNQILSMGDEFVTMNRGAVDELIDLDNLSSMEELYSVLADINEGGTEMFLELAGA